MASHCCVEVGVSWCRGLRDTQGVDDVGGSNIDHHAEPEPNNDVEEEPEQEDDLSVVHDDSITGDESNSEEEWNEFEDMFNTVVENLKKVAKEKFKEKDEKFIKGMRNFTKRLDNSVSNDNRLMTLS